MLRLLYGERARQAHHPLLGDVIRETQRRDLDLIAPRRRDVDDPAGPVLAQQRQRVLATVEDAEETAPQHQLPVARAYFQRRVELKPAVVGVVD